LIAAVLGAEDYSDHLTCLTIPEKLLCKLLIYKDTELQKYLRYRTISQSSQTREVLDGSSIAEMNRNHSHAP
jgi:hypothetical protein